jgi:hypothetical protein
MASLDRITTYIEQTKIQITANAFGRVLEQSQIHPSRQTQFLLNRLQIHEDAMKYHDGQEIHLGDRVALGGDSNGVVVCVLDTGEYSPRYSEAEWGYLKQGVIIDFPTYGKIHYKEAIEPAVHLIART